MKEFGSDESLVYAIYMKRAMETDYKTYMQKEIAEISGWPLHACGVHTPAREYFLEGILRLKKDCYQIKSENMSRHRNG